MRSFVMVVLMFAAACGDVVKSTDGGTGDAVGADSTPALTCAATETVCNGTCADLMTSETSCGACDTPCAPTFSCLTGTCVVTNSSCAIVRALDPAAADGVYINPNNGASIHCSFTANLQYEIVTNPYTTAPAGYSVARATDFANADFAKAFIAIYNHDVGIRAFSTFTFNNCCMGPLAATRYGTGAGILFVGKGSASFCNQQVPVNTYLTFGPNGSSYLTSLASNQFTVSPISEPTGCSDSNNVAWWFKRTTF